MEQAVADAMLQMAKLIEGKNLIIERQARQLEAAVEGLERLGTCHCEPSFECDMHRTLAKIKQIGDGE